MQSEEGLVLWDGFPVSEAHSLVVPRQHVASLFDLPQNTQAGLWALTARVRDALRERTGVSAFNIGINDGAAGGQTVAHAHIHIIPRRHGDVDDPRGGIRWVLPQQADYWT